MLCRQGFHIDFGFFARDSLGSICSFAWMHSLLNEMIFVWKNSSARSGKREVEKRRKQIFLILIAFRLLENFLNIFQKIRCFIPFGVHNRKGINFRFPQFSYSQSYWSKRKFHIKMSFICFQIDSCTCTCTVHHTKVAAPECLMDRFTAWKYFLFSEQELEILTSKERTVNE